MQNFKVSNLGGDFGRPQLSNYLIAFCPHIDCVSMLCLESVALMVSEKRCLDMTDRRTDGQTDRRTGRRTDMAKSDFLVALIKNICIYYIGSHMSSSACYIHSA